MKQLLQLDASANLSSSASKKLGAELVAKFQKAYPKVQLKQRDLNQGLDFIDEGWVSANLTPADQRTLEHQQTLALSDVLIAELQQADRIVITTPMYNFGVPATLKAWIDLVCRAGITFQYSSEGPVGLLKDKRVDIVITTGGVPLQSPVDFVSAYLKQVFHFIGIDDINFIAADQMAIDADNSFDKAKQQIEDLNIISRAA